MTVPAYNPMPVLDIVSYGYRQFFRAIVPLTKLSLPFLLFAAITGGFIYPDLLKVQAAGEPSVEDLGMFLAMSSMMGLGTVVMYYALYPMLRYVRDVYADEIKDSLFSYLIPQGSLLGLLGIMICYAVGSVLAVLLTFIGFLLLVVPGLVLIGGIFFLNYRFAMVWVAYMDAPSQGVFNAFRESWRLTENNFWRTVGLGIVCTIIQSILNFPFSLVDFFMGFLSGLNPSMVNHPVFPVVSASLLGVSYWAQFVLGFGGIIFVFYRYLFDLRVRKGEPAAGAGSADNPQTFWTPPNQ